mmetsp:Transcript_13131/g.52377  ORF Transcript_13131/g.52377 Transcript_13131/m.52377 type:complete len:259 (+) Transcript_13131:22-798(+)
MALAWIVDSLTVANVARVAVGLIAVIGACTWLLQALVPYVLSLLPQGGPEKPSAEEVAMLELERRQQVLELQERQRKASEARARKEEERMAKARTEQEERELRKRETYSERQGQRLERQGQRLEAKKERGSVEQLEVDDEGEERNARNEKRSLKMKKAIAERRKRVPKEPPAPVSPEDQEHVTKVVVRLVSGKPVTRRFSLDTPLAVIKDWVELEEPSLIGQEFVFRTTYPHRTHDKLTATLRDAGIKGTVLLVSLVQ